MKRAGIRRGDEVCSTTKMMKRTIKKVVPSWIFFACGGPNNKGDPGSPSKAFARTETAGRKSDGTTPASPGNDDLRLEVSQIRKRAFCLPFSRGLKLLRFRGKMCRGNRPRFSPDETCDFTPVFLGRGSKAHTGGIFELRIGSQLRLSE